MKAAAAVLVGVLPAPSSMSWKIWDEGTTVGIDTVFRHSWTLF
jgi:hypothetical protein